MKNTLLFTALVLLSVLNACTKKNPSSPEERPVDTIPEIVIKEPSRAHYEAGDTVLVHVVVTDSKEMHEAKYWIIAVPQQDTLWYQRKHAHTATIVLDTRFIPPVLQPHQEMELVVLAENSEGKTAEARHIFEIH